MSNDQNQLKLETVLTYTYSNAGSECKFSSLTAFVTSHGCDEGILIIKRNDFVTFSTFLLQRSESLKKC